MENATYYEYLLQNSYFNLAFGCTVLIVIAAIIGVMGNFLIIFFYFFRLKDRGERYFIPLLAIVDMLACITSSAYNIMDNTYFFNYPSEVACRLLCMLQVCVPGISAHILLLISIQRYLLVCKPFGPKMTLFWKRLSFALVCGITLVYSAPILGTSGILTSGEIYMNTNITVHICKFSVDSSLKITVYFGILSLIIVGNIMATASFYIPVLKQVKISFRSFRSKLPNTEGEREETAVTETESVVTSKYEQIEMKVMGVNGASNASTIQLPRPNSSQVDIVQTNASSSDTLHSTTPRGQDKSRDKNDTERKGGAKPKQGSVQRRLTVMFFVLILTYIISYIPPLVFLILTYSIEDFNFISLSKTEALVWIYVPRLVFLNHVINPFIYGYYDTKFREALMSCFKGRIKTF